jgi:hypothetical protein
VIKTDGHTDGAAVSGVFASYVLGLQNLYSSVRSRPAPPTFTPENKAHPVDFAACNGPASDRAITGRNGEEPAKRGGPSEFRPCWAVFRPCSLTRLSRAALWLQSLMDFGPQSLPHVLLCRLLNRILAGGAR